MLNKKKLVARVIEGLEAEIENIQNVIETEHKALKDAPHAMQSWSDTTRSQKENLIFGLNNQLLVKKAILETLHSLNIVPHNTIQVGSFITLLDKEDTIYYFIIPGNTGEQFEIDGIEIKIISPASVVSRSLHGHELGDIVNVEVPAGVRKLKILAVE